MSSFRLPVAVVATWLWAGLMALGPAFPAAGAKPEVSKAQQAAEEAARESYELYKAFVDAMDQVERNYVQEISRRELMEAAIQGILSKLDQHSAYISPEEINQFKTSVDNRFGGIGIQIEMDRQHGLRVLSPLVGTPAYRAGLIAGDRILEIEGASTADLQSVDEAVDKLKGEPGTSVTITILHPGSREPKQVTIEREIIQVETVLGDQRKADDSWDFMFDREHGIGYVRITAFSRETSEELAAAIEELTAQGLRGLILDLRFNPGGLLASAIEVSDLFLAEGRIVSTEGRNSTPRAWDAEKEGTFEGFPMVVLVNRYSASASEIVSAALQDHGRAVVVGERTYGKGSVQNVIELEGGRSALKLTTASYQRPNGKNIHRFPDDTEENEWGVRPNEGYEVMLTAIETRALIETRRRRDIVEAHPSPDSPADEAPGGEVPPAANEGKPPAEPAPELPASDGSSPQPEQSGPEQPRPDEQPPAGEPDEALLDGQPPSDAAMAEFVDRQLIKALEYLRAEIGKSHASAAGSR